jgi:hypothetical protein
MLLAWKRVKANKGAAGVDGMSIDAFPEFARHHWERIRSALEKGNCSNSTNGYAAACGSAIGNSGSDREHGGGICSPSASCVMRSNSPREAGRDTGGCHDLLIDTREEQRGYQKAFQGILSAADSP